MIVEFPLRGDWIAPNTPGHRVPSHGTDIFGQTYAYDFLKVDAHFPDKWRVSKKLLLGNYIILRGIDAVALIAHARQGS